MASAWQRVLCAVASSGLILTLSAPTHAVIENESPYDYWVKPERGEIPIYVQRGGTHDGSQDGLAVPALRRNAVFKVCDFCKAIVKKGDIETDCYFFSKGRQKDEGGWKDEGWVKQHPDWKPLFDRSR